MIMCIIAKSNINLWRISMRNFILLILLFIHSFNSHSIIPRKYNYPDPPINILKEAVVPFGSVNATFIEIIDLTASIVYDHISIESSLDNEIMIRIGTTGGEQFTVRGGTSLVMSNIGLPGKIYMKYSSGAPTSGKIIFRFW